MAVTGLTVLRDAEEPLPGWVKDKNNLNEGTSGTRLYFASERDGKEAPLTDVQFIRMEHGIPPAGYEKNSTDLNEGAGGRTIYTCYTRDPLRGTAIEDIYVLASDQRDTDCLPENYFKIPVDLNEGAHGKFIYLCYLAS
ncbi:hypothetical protein [Kitasatospora sp. HPMI-4]|uniref:hypothetical protein n=1 Tax=Kitasatospora sp. HPMI-4 TaxID=3448443 RepID=UPI003F1985D5